MVDKYVDLTHTLDESIPVWPGSTRFSRYKRADIEHDGYRLYDYHFSEGLGTHMDAPAHFVQNGRAIADFTLNELIAPACVFKVNQAVSQNPDYAISVDDINDWEKSHGLIPEGCIVIADTGWSVHFEAERSYRNPDNQGQMHFPGFSKAAAQCLVQRKIVGVGIDTISLDPAIAIDYPAHQVFLGAGIFQLENLAHLYQLPPIGATLFVLPLKIKAGPEAPARIIARLPA